MSSPRSLHSHRVSVEIPPTGQDPLSHPGDNSNRRHLSENIVRIVNNIKACRHGAPYSTWESFPLLADELRVFNDLLEEDYAYYYTYDLRYVYFSDLNRIILKRWTILHAVFLRLVTDDIDRQLEAMQGPARPFTQMMWSIGRSPFFLGLSRTSVYCPDTSFHYATVRSRCMIIEVIDNAQQRKDLAKLTDDYILNSYGNIKQIIGLNITCPGKEATLSVWEPYFWTNASGERCLGKYTAVDAEVFRDAGGNAVGPGLKLRLGKILPIPLLPPDIHSMVPSPLEEIIHIPASDLCEYLADAEERYSRARNGSPSGIIRHPPRGSGEGWDAL